MPCAAVFLGAEKEAEFQRHVEPRQRRIAIDLRPRDVMNAISAFRNDLADLVEAILGRIVGFKRATGAETRSDDREDNGVEKGAVVGIERTIDEDVAVFRGHSVFASRRFSKPAHRFVATDIHDRLFDLAGRKVLRLAFRQQNDNPIGERPYALVGARIRCSVCFS